MLSRLLKITKRLVLFAILFTTYFVDAAEDFDQLIAEGKKIVLSTKRIILEEYPDAWNPTMIKIDQGYLLAFRYTPDRENQAWVSFIGVVLLNEAFEPITEPQLLTTRSKYSVTPSQSEDPRLFVYRGRIYLLYNDNVDIIHPETWERRDLFMVELFFKDNTFSFSLPIKLYYEPKYNSSWWQKNWIPFEWNKQLLLIYSIDPHEVIVPNLTNGACYLFNKTTPSHDWQFGILRGSSAALLVDGEYLAFFHSHVKTISPVSWGWELYHYFMGAYTFSAEPPFEVTKISPKPIIGEGFYTTCSYYKRVIFPGGFVVDGPLIYMAYGKDDCEMWIATLDKIALKKSLVSVAKKENGKK